VGDILADDDLACADGQMDQSVVCAEGSFWMIPSLSRGPDEFLGRFIQQGYAAGFHLECGQDVRQGLC
jgi:hypothetical protein